MNIPFNLRLNYDGLKAPGDAYFTGGPYAAEHVSPDVASRSYDDLRFCTHPTRLQFICPARIPPSEYSPDGLVHAGIRIAGDHSWMWNGDYYHPTFSPSILVNHLDSEIWHGYLVNGVFRLDPPNIEEATNLKHWAIDSVPLFIPSPELLEASRKLYKE